MKYVISHDIGTSSVKTVLVDFEGNIIADLTASYNTYYPYPSWVEQCPQEYWQGVCQNTRRILEESHINKHNIKGMTFVTQAMGIIPVDDKGDVLYNNISWADSRAQQQAQKIMKRLGGKRVFTFFAGTPIIGKDVIPKLVWLKENKPKIYAKTKYFLDVNGYIKYRATGKMVAELSGVSSYGLNFKSQKFHIAFKRAGIDMKKLPPIVKSTDLVGGLTLQASKELGLYEGLPIFGGCDDVQSASIGSGMSNDKDVHMYLGTSAWVCASSKRLARFKKGVAVLQSANPNMHLIVGVSEAAGSNIIWLLEQFFASEKEEKKENIFSYVDQQVASVSAGSNHLICTPWMLGERCPVSSTNTRATLFNINPNHTKAHMLRAMYEGIGYNINWILQSLKENYKLDFDSLRVVGGGSQSSQFMQILADIIGKKLTVTKNARSIGAYGGAIIALIGLGQIESFSSVKHIVEIYRTYNPNKENRKIYDKLYIDYKNIYYGLKKTYKQANSGRFKEGY